MSKDWAEQFTRSLMDLRKRDETIACAYEVPVEKIWSEEFNDLESEHIRLMSAILKGVWDSKIGPFLHDLNVALASAESPIEKAMLGALMVAGYSVAQGVICKFTDKQGFEHTFGDTADQYNSVTIELQKPMGNYRVDFFLSYREYGSDPDRQIKSKDGQEVSGSAWYTGELILECDGHDFHDRTKEQASRDRQRDRLLQDLGYRVFRFTGSDLWRDVFACAQEALKAVSNRQFHKKVPILDRHPV